MLTLNAEIESHPEGFLAWISGNEKFKIVVDGKTPEDALRELLISLQVHFAYNFGLEIKEPPIHSFENIEMVDGRTSKEISILF